MGVEGKYRCSSKDFSGLHDFNRLGRFDIVLADVDIMVGSWILREVSEIDPLEVGPGEVEDQLRLDK